MKDLQVDETSNGYRAIVFKGIEDLLIAADIVIHSNVYKIRTSLPKKRLTSVPIPYSIKSSKYQNKGS